MGEVKKVLYLADIHYDQFDPAVMAAIEKFMPVFYPDILVYLGDIIDPGYMSHWETDNLLLKENRRLSDDFDSINKMFDRHVALCGDPEVWYYYGNHELWIEKAISKNPQGLQGFIDLDIALHLKERGFKVFDYNETGNIDKIYATHGTYHNKHHAAKHVETYHRTIIYGHLHTFQSFTEVSPIDCKDIHTSYAIGCIAKKNPKYKKNAPTAFVNGFAVSYSTPEFFNIYPVVVTEGKFIWNGQVYDGNDRIYK